MAQPSGARLAELSCRAEQQPPDWALCGRGDLPLATVYPQAQPAREKQLDIVSDAYVSSATPV